MIDSIQLELVIKEENRLSIEMFKRTMTGTYQKGKYLHGWLKNLKFKVKMDKCSKYFVSDGVLYMHGSIPKYLHGDNLSNVSRRDVRNVFRDLNRLLRVNLFFARINSLHVAENVLLKHPVYEYLNSIHSYPNLKPVLYHRESIYFCAKHKGFTISFYDKLAELKSKNKGKNKVDIKSIEHLNILRIEVKEDKLPMKKIFNEQNCNLKQLLKKGKYSMLADYWLQHINRTNFNQNCPDTFKFNTRKEFERWNLLENIKENGIDLIIQKVKGSKLKPVAENNILEDIKKTLTMDREPEQTSPLYIELKDAVQLAYRYHK